MPEATCRPPRYHPEEILGRRLVGPGGAGGRGWVAADRQDCLLRVRRGLALLLQGTALDLHRTSRRAVVLAMPN